MVQFLKAMGCYGENKIEDFEEFEKTVAYREFIKKYFTDEGIDA